MIGGQGALDWLAHRAGVRKLTTNPVECHTGALELNKHIEDLNATLGKREMRGFVGFVDIIGFSERVKGRTPREVADYLKPFLDRIVGAAVDRHALIDKTIGDEVMFVIPEFQEHNDPMVLMVGHLLPRILEIRESLGDRYPLRIGLSYGDLYVDRVGDGGFSELTIFGEAVHLAKRLCDSKLLRDTADALGMFGVLKREPRAMARFDSILGIVAGFASKVDHKVVDMPQGELKGISEARCALILPKPEADRPKCEIVEERE